MTALTLILIATTAVALMAAAVTLAAAVIQECRETAELAERIAAARRDDR